MGDLKTFLIVLILLPYPCRAAEDALVNAFATCTGRYSAEIEHAWLMPDTDPTELEHRRGQFIGLLNAILPGDGQRAALNLRIDAKLAHKQLLSQAAFSKDRDQSTWALRRAKSEIDFCSGFLLDS